MANQLREQVIQSVSRRLVSELLSIPEHPESFLDDFHVVIKAMGGVHEGVLPALCEALKHDSSHVRTFAGALVLQMTAMLKDTSVPREVLEVAEQSLVAGLENGNEKERLVACSLLTNGITPTSAIPPLRAMLKSGEEPFATFAAAALCNSGAAAIAIPHLTTRMREADETTSGIAANALARIGVQKPEAIREMISLLERLQNPYTLYYVIESLNLIGPPAKAALPQLTAIAKDEDMHPHVARTAVVAIGSVTRGSDDGIPILKEALASWNPILIDAAAEAFEAMGHDLDIVIERMCELLTTGIVEARQLAALCLSRLGEKAAKAAPALISAALVEQDVDALQAMTVALALLGKSVIPHMVDLLKQSSFTKVAIASSVFIGMQSDGAEALARILGDNPDPNTCKKAVAILQHLGEKAGHVVPRLADILDSTTDDELAGYLIVAIFNTGLHAKQAIPSLVNCLAARKDEIVFWAEGALCNIGREAIPALEAALKSATGKARRRIERTLEEMQDRKDERFAKFDALNRDDLLEMFSYVGHAFTTCGSTSWETIERQLEATIGLKNLDSLSFGASESSLI